MRFHGPLLAERTLKRYIDFLKNVDTKNNNDAYYKNKVLQLLAIFELPVPSPQFLEHSSSNSFGLFVSGVFSRLIESQHVTKELIEELSKVMRLKNLGGHRLSSSWYRLRIFEADGRYPNTSFLRHNAKYEVFKGVPYVLTHNFHSAEEHAIGGGEENSVLTRKEVKLLASLLCINGLIVNFSLTDSIDRDNVLDVDASYLGSIREEYILEYLLEYASTIGKLTPKNKDSYEFASSSGLESDIAKFYAGFRIDDFLLLRTSYLLIKASSLILSRNYFEDSVANIFMGLEGVMTMMQRNDGQTYASINRRYLKRKFESIFHDSGQTYDFVMDEVFEWGEKRAALVHPQAGTDWGWVPFIVGEDYPDYRNIFRSLLYYAVTGISYDPYEYYPK